MLNIERAVGYAWQRGIECTVGDTEEGPWPDRLLPQLTGPQRRRIKHKKHALSGHSHERGVRCLRCKPAPSEPGPDAWRQSGRKLLDQL